jgi:hypothetical protein
MFRLRSVPVLSKVVVIFLASIADINSKLAILELCHYCIQRAILTDVPRIVCQISGGCSWEDNSCMKAIEHPHRGMYDKVWVQVHSFLTSKLDGGQRLPCPSHFVTGAKQIKIVL